MPAPHQQKHQKPGAAAPAAEAELLQRTHGITVCQGYALPASDDLQIGGCEELNIKIKIHKHEKTKT